MCGPFQLQGGDGHHAHFEIANFGRLKVFNAVLDRLIHGLGALLVMVGEQLPNVKFEIQLLIGQISYLYVTLVQKAVLKA